jgi:uncharacterized membrane protein YphA (DoxX/SURF4 family)
LAIYLFPASGTLVGMWGVPSIPAYEALLHKIVVWFGGHILHLKHAITIFPEDSGGTDPAYSYIASLLFLVVAAIATVVWSALDRKRIAYPKLNQWFLLYVRVVLAIAMLSYGANKIMPAQMPPPSLTTLMQPFGDLPPYRLMWNFIGSSPTYEIFAGSVETLGGILLLIPGLSTLGALVSLGALTNVFMMDWCYGVPVKFWALHLMLLAVLVLLPDATRLINLLVLHRPTEPEQARPLFERRWLNGLVWVLQWAVGIHLLVTTVGMSRMSVQGTARIGEGNPFYGIWTVDEFAMDGQVHPPLMTDKLRWQRMIFSSAQTLSIQDMNGQIAPYALSINARKGSLLIARLNTDHTSSPWWSEWYWQPVSYDTPDPAWRSRAYAEFTYSQPQGDAMVLDGAANGHQLHLALKKEQREFLLKTSPGPSWIKEDFEFNNENRLK